VSPMIVLAGVGSPYRRDDGVGPQVVARVVAATTLHVHDIGPIADPLDLLGLWDGADLAVVVDATCTGVPAGTVRCVDLGGQEEPAVGVVSSHGIGLAGALRLAAVLERAPRRVVAVGVEGADFGRGVGLTPSVEAAVGEAARTIVELIREVQPCA
jgi:hydrogenase maturation protease